MARQAQIEASHASNHDVDIQTAVDGNRFCNTTNDEKGYSKARSAARGGWFRFLGRMPYRTTASGTQDERVVDITAGHDDIDWFVRIANKRSMAIPRGATAAASGVVRGLAAIRRVRAIAADRVRVATPPPFRL